MHLNDLYAQRAATPSDISEHMPVLRALASECGHVTEFGTRHGNSTVALLAGLADGAGLEGTLVSYDIDPGCAHAIPHGTEGLPNWQFHGLADTGQLVVIEETDMLFIDTLHDAAHVARELVHAISVRRFLVFHDTVTFGVADETTGQPPGILQPIWEFLASHEGARYWRVRDHFPNNNGLLVLENRR